MQDPPSAQYICGSQYGCVPGGVIGTLPGGIGSGVGLIGSFFDSGIPGAIGGAIGNSVKQIPGGIGSGASTIGSASDLISTIGTLFGQHAFWIRVILIVGGVFAVMVGLSGLAHIAAGDIAPIAAPIAKAVAA